MINKNTVSSLTGKEAELAARMSYEKKGHCHRRGTGQLFTARLFLQAEIGLQSQKEENINSH